MRERGREGGRVEGRYVTQLETVMKGTADNLHDPYMCGVANVVGDVQWVLSFALKLIHQILELLKQVHT